MQLTRKGEAVDVLESLPTVGEQAPDFSLKNTNGETVSKDSLKGKVVIISVFPDINTSVCDKQAREFNEKASGIDGVHLVSVSTNTKEDLTSWCAAEGLEMEMLPDAKAFGEAYGIEMKSMGVLARSVFVISQEGLLAYKEVVQEMVDEPNYDAAIEAAKDLL